LIDVCGIGLMILFHVRNGAAGSNMIGYQWRWSHWPADHIKDGFQRSAGWRTDFVKIMSHTSRFIRWTGFIHRNCTEQCAWRTERERTAFQRDIWTLAKMG